MIGLNDQYSSPLPEVFNADIVIYGESFPRMSMKELVEDNEKLADAAEALGDEHVPLVPTYKEHGLALHCAVIAYSDNETTRPMNKALPDNWEEKKTLGELQTFVVNQMPLTWVFNYSRTLQKEGKPFGYNFQRKGLIGSALNVKNTKTMIGYLHPNPNVEKDWDNNVTALEVDPDDEMYGHLLEKERDRIATWERVCKLWKKLDEHEAKGELKEALARRLCLLDTNNALILPKPGLVFRTRCQLRDGKYVEPEPFIHNKEITKINTEPIEIGKPSFVNYSLLAELIKQRRTKER